MTMELRNIAVNNLYLQGYLELVKNKRKQNIMFFFFLDCDSVVTYQHNSFFSSFDFTSVLPEVDNSVFLLSDMNYDH